MLFLDSTDLLKIEDILPFFPDFVVIDDFKESICQALEGYSSHIESLKEDMDEATRSAQAIKSDIVDLKNRFVVVDPAEKCRSCGEALLTRQFYIFPCQHAFHADCLIKEVRRFHFHLRIHSLILMSRSLNISLRLPSVACSTSNPSSRPPRSTDSLVLDVKQRTEFRHPKAATRSRRGN